MFRNAGQQTARRELETLVPQRCQGRSGGLEMELLASGIVLFRLSGVMDLELAQQFAALLDGLYQRLAAEDRCAQLLIDASELVRLTFQAQHLLLTRNHRAVASITGLHCVTGHPLFRLLIGLYQRLGTQPAIQIHPDRAAALAALNQHPADAGKGPELSEEAFDSPHAAMRYYRPRPEILLSESLGITNASAVHHMLAVHGHWLAWQRRQFGRAILIVDARGTRHCTMEAYRILSGELGEAGPRPRDIICVITRHWPQAVARLVQHLLRRLEFRLLVAGSLDEALALIDAQQAPQPPVRDRGRAGLRHRLAQLEAENQRLRAERESLVSGVGGLLSEILLHQPATEMPRAEQPDVQELYESLYLLQHDYQAYLQTLQQEIDERIQAEHRAAELSQVKTRFLGNVSHELRTPLNAIIGFTRLLLKGKGGELAPSQRLYLERIKDNSLHLLALINDVLDISRIETGSLRLQQAPHDLRRLIARVLEPHELYARNKGLELLFVAEAEAPAELSTDADRLRQIVSNLVANAIKFTASGEVRVRYRAWKQGPYVAAIEVEDTGIGIPREAQKTIFEAFTQAHDGSYAGAGLGLSICLSLAQLLGYLIELESEPGAGACFRLLLTAVSPGG